MFEDSDLTKKEKRYKRFLIFRIIFNPFLWIRNNKTTTTKKQENQIINFLIRTDLSNIKFDSKTYRESHCVDIYCFRFWICNYPYASGVFDVYEKSNMIRKSTPTQFNPSTKLSLVLRDLLRRKDDEIMYEEKEKKIEQTQKAMANSLIEFKL